jgi:hypothetical protein
MAVISKIWLFVVLCLILTTSSAIAESFTLDANVLTAASQVNPNIWKIALACSPIFFVFDAICTFATIYFLKKFVTRKKAAKL